MPKSRDPGDYGLRIHSGSPNEWPIPYGDLHSVHHWMYLCTLSFYIMTISINEVKSGSKGKSSFVQLKTLAKNVEKVMQKLY